MDIEKTIITRMVNNERKKIGPMLAENRKIRGGNIKKRKKGKMADFDKILWSIC